MTEREYIKISFDRIAKRLKLVPVSLWKDGTYMLLSEGIENETGILISKNTLKRLTGKMSTDGYYRPQRETKNALAAYAGYESWEKFELEVQEENKIPEKEIQIINEPIASFEMQTSAVSEFEIALPQKKKPTKWLVIGLLALCLIVGFFIFSKLFSKPELPLPEAELTILNPVDTVPYNLRIAYKTKNVALDSLIIAQTPVYEQNGKLNLGIVNPIYTWVYIKHKNKTLSTKPYHAVSRGWTSSFQQKRKQTQMHIKDAYWRKNGEASLAKEWFAGKQLDSLAFFWNLLNFRNFPLDGDHFSFESKVKPQGDDLSCNRLLFTTFAEGGHLEACLNAKSCANHNYIYLSDLIVEGEYRDFPELNLRPNEWSIVRMEVKNKHVTILVDQKIIFEGRYKKSVGQVKGFTIKFLGFGSVDYFRAWDKNGKLVEEENF